MRFANSLSLVALLLTALALAAGNLWVTAARSLIPLAVDGTVAQRQIRHEKHPGHDDVCLWTLADGRVLHVDQAIVSFRQARKTLAAS